MSLSIGIFGLPNVGKSTLFKILTKRQVNISDYPFSTINPNVGMVKVPDERLEKLGEISPGKKITPPWIKFVDVAGLVKGASQGEGLGNQFLAHLRETNVLLHIVRCFQDKNISHIEGEVNPKRDIEIVTEELIFKDLETIENRLNKIEKEIKRKEKRALEEKEVLEFYRDALLKKSLNFSFLKNLNQSQKEILEDLFLLTLKPQIYLLNGKKEEISLDVINFLKERNEEWIRIDLKKELDCQDLTDEERKEIGCEGSKTDQLIKRCYKVLNLITFFTITGEKEIKGWSIKKGTTIFEAAGKIHSDFQKKFIKGEVINWKKLTEIGSWQECQRRGLLKLVGKDYILEDGDVIEIKI